MNHRNSIGKAGESAACTHLKECGYHILERNWRYKRAEVDIIAWEANTLVFVEVKTRRSEFFGVPEAFVTLRKQKMLASAAGAYSFGIQHAGEVRFDVVSVLFSKSDFHVTLLRDAFFPGLA